MSFERISELKHKRKPLSGGGQVIVVDNGAIIGAEAMAMLQALHSRSTGGFDSHLKKLEKIGPEKFMETYYVNYGHKSIGDCGFATVFVEGISMLCAKAIQDWMLYNGQEASTRYIDFSKQEFLNPLNTPLGNQIQENWRNFYLTIIEKLKHVLKRRFPIQEGEKDDVYEKAIVVRAFDIARSFLPAGATTNLAWTMTLRQFADQLMLLRNHPLKEIKEVGLKTEEALYEMYPSSFSQKRYSTTEYYNAEYMSEDYYFYDTPENFPEFRMTSDSVDIIGISHWERAMKDRPPKTELPKKINELGTMQFEFLLDFGSFRDLQRHRSIIQQMPLLSLDFGFNKWYLNELNFFSEVPNFLESQKKSIQQLNADDKMSQYYIAMGYNCPCRITGGLSSLVYTTELRTTRFVHPSLFEQMLKIAEILKTRFGRHGLVLHLDSEPTRFDVRRAEHDIKIKK